MGKEAMRIIIKERGWLRWVSVLAVVSAVGFFISQAAEWDNINLAKAENVEEALVGWWSFDEGEGEIAKDKSSSGNAGSVHGAQWAKGVSGSCLNFDGRDDYVDCGNNPSFYPVNITVEMWVKPSGGQESAIIAGYLPNYKGYMLFNHRFSVYDGTEKQADASYSLEPQEWAYIVGTFDGNTVKVYKNGRLESSAQQTKLLLSGANVTIGKASHYDGAYFHGLIDEVKIYNRALSNAEIQKMWEQISHNLPASSRKQENIPVSPATILEPQEGVSVALADHGFYNYEHYSHAILSSPAQQIKKIIDLSGIPEKVWSKTESIQVNVCMYTEDPAGKGLNENFAITVNGHKNTFSTNGLVSDTTGRIGGAGWFDLQHPIGWFNFSIPREQLIKGKNEIAISNSSGTINVGIDIFEPKGCSFISYDGGNTWRSAPLNRYGFSGELMVRLTLFSNKTLVGKTRFSQDDIPEMPVVNLNLPVKALSPPADTKARLVQEEKQDVFENGWMRLKINYDNGFILKELVHKPMGVNALRENDGVSLFLTEVAGEKVYSRDYTLKDKKVLTSGPDQNKVIYYLQNSASGVSVEFQVEMDRTQELKLKMTVWNNGPEQLIKVAYPMIYGIGWSPDFKDDYYLYPYKTGAILTHPISFLSAYGGHTTYLQQMASYSPKAGGGLYLRTNDSAGLYKILHFEKTDEDGREPTFRFQPVVVEMQNGRSREDLLILDPLPKSPGTNMSFSYSGMNLKTNEKWDLPEAVLGVMNGDWRAAMESYREWYETWSHKQHFPNKLTNVFNHEGISSIYHFHNKDGYNTDIRKPGHHLMGHVRPTYWSENTPDMLEHVCWDGAEVVTPEHQKEMESIAQKYGKEYKIWRDAVIDGIHYSWDFTMGDYGLTGYNEMWGGLPAFKKYLAEMKEKGFVVTLYINKAHAGLNSIIGKKYGPQWGVMWPEGNYYWPYWMWEMCNDNPLWRQYLADTCKRLIKETGADGIRIDELGGAQRICYNPQHQHTFALPGQYTTLQAQTDACRRIREAVDEVDPNAVLMSETPGQDTMWQYLDGTLSYDLSSSPLTGSRAKGWEGFVGIDINRFYFPRFKFFDYEMFEKYPAWRLFNGTGAFNREWFYNNHELQILKENSDAFGSLNPTPLIPTLISMVYVNKFPGKDKTIYTVYNARKSKITGEVFAIDSIKDFHIVDLYNHNEVKTTEEGNKTIVNIDLDSRSVGCLAYLPDVMDISVKDKKVNITTNALIEDASVKIVDLKGQIITEYEMQGTEYNLPFPDTDKAMCKLYSGKRLVDALPLKKTIP